MKSKPHFFISAALAVLPSLSVLAKPVKIEERITFDPIPRSVHYTGKLTHCPARISVAGLDGLKPTDAATIETLTSLFAEIGVPGDFGGNAAYKIQFQHSDDIGSAEGYELTADESGIKVTSRTEAGAFYGAQTLYQLLSYAKHGSEFLHFSETPAEGTDEFYVPNVAIKDEPTYKTRAFMADLGRAPFSLPLLKRLIRIMAQLKMNLLHLHLYDDQLCGFRFKNLPLGNENPFSIDADQLKALVAYARRYHIAVMPELESWGHVGSLAYHYPELAATEGVFGGASFGIGEKTYALLAQIYDEIVPCLEDEANVHVGLDEAQWAVLPGEENKGHTPTNMVGRIHAILMKVAARHGKKITMHLWADHGGRALPAELEHEVVIEPWRYLGADEASIVENCKKYGGDGKTRFMMGSGANSYAYSGNFDATRIWCLEGLKFPNVEGVTLCMWESNDLSGRLVTLYGGANFAWFPQGLPRAKNDTTGERLRQLVDKQMRSWQIIYPDADPAAIDRDRGPEVKSGRYAWGPFAGKPVAPTVNFSVKSSTGR